ncbi:hypothetical protein KC19_VG020500, partial [Ceratodon purpureus]
MKFPQPQCAGILLPNTNSDQTLADNPQSTILNCTKQTNANSMRFSQPQCAGILLPGTNSDQTLRANPCSDKMCELVPIPSFTFFAPLPLARRA